MISRQGENELVISFTSHRCRWRDAGQDLHSAQRRDTTSPCDTPSRTPVPPTSPRSCISNSCATATSLPANHRSISRLPVPPFTPKRRNTRKSTSPTSRRTRRTTSTARPNGYIAMVQHYFASAWMLPDGMQRNISLDAVDIGSTVADCCYRATMIAPLEPIAPARNESRRHPLFRRPAGRKSPGGPGARAGAGQGLWLADDPGQAAVLVARQDRMAFWATGAGPSWVWCCCSRSRSTGSTPRRTAAWPR